MSNGGHSMSRDTDTSVENPSTDRVEAKLEPAAGGFSRRSLLELTSVGAAGLALEGFIDVPAMRAATRDLKLSNVSEFTTSCNFCSCGCGMIAAVREGKLISMEGDYDHIVNRGSLCVKGISMFA